VSYDIYGNRLRSGYCEVHPNVPESFPCSQCAYEYQPQPDYPEPTLEELCDPHSYYGDDHEQGDGRCYCGTKRYPRAKGGE
jgi:hypothetical protein